MTSKVKITLIKSLIGRKEKHIAIAKQLGLKKIHACVEHDDTPCIQGMINQINYLVTVEETR